MGEDCAHYLYKGKESNMRVVKTTNEDFGFVAEISVSIVSLTVVWWWWYVVVLLDTFSEN